MGFTLKDILHNKAKTLLHLETDPGLGCTEPAAIGLSAAAAVTLLKEKTIDSIEVLTDPNIYKNAMGVIIPGTNGQSGIPLAAAMGAVAGDPENRLQVFSTIDKEGLEKAESLLREGKVSAEITEGHSGLYIRTLIKGGDHTAEAVISGRHDHIESLRIDGKLRKDHRLLTVEGSEDPNTEDLKQWLTSLSIGEIVNLLDGLDGDDAAYIQRGIDLNMELVRYGLSHGPGLGVGKTQQSLLRQGLLKNDMVLRGGILAAAGIDSRMGGAMLPALTLAGSGNQGIAAVICDGAKTSCALKVGESTSSAVKSALMALQGTVVKSIDGIIDESPEATMRNLAKLTRSGLKDMDPAILDIMLHKCP